MQLATRPWTTTAVALVGAGSIAAVPVAQQAPDLLDLQSRAVRLTSGIDPFTAWVDQFNTAQDNLTSLTDNFFLAPAVGLQQAIVNQVGYLTQILSDPQSIPDVLKEAADNLTNVLSSYLLIGASSSTIGTVTGNTVDTLHGLIASLLPSFLPGITEVLDYLQSPASGMLVGAAGPFISPWVSLLNSAESVVNALVNGDPTAALQDLLDTPANFVGSIFNGATLNLDALIPLISGIFPPGITLDGLSYAFGGLLTAGAVQATYHLYDHAGDTVATVPAVGGSMLNGLGLDIGLNPTVTLDIPGEPVGLLGAHIGYSEAIGALLGDGWDGKNAPATPPLATLTFPTLDPSSAGAVDPSVATDLSNLLAGDTLSSFNLGDLADLPDHLITALLGLF